ncbi:MAG TPA: hypothetical protein VG326_01345 [Tepidisphaeraceae bacterium]|jgi:hypothetical protein|nr:hypothetical protein [Tepidisphaeraceae bacterium]
MVARTLIFAFVSLGCLVVSSSAQDAKAPREGAFEQQRKQHRDGVMQYPLIKQRKLDEIFRLQLDGGELAVTTPLEPDREYQQRRAEIDGMSEPAMILCWLMSPDLGEVQFEISVEDYSDPLAVGRLHVTARPGGAATAKQLENIEIEKVWQTSNGFRKVALNQVGESAKMIIFANDGGPNGFINLSIEEKDFATLRRLHHSETERWLRPILRELHQESAFAADPAAAWQILAEQWPADDHYQGLVAENLKSLNDDDFRVRRKACQALQKLGRDGALAMIKMDRRGLSLEQNVRLDEMIARYKPLPDAEARRLGKDRDFLLDCLYGDDPIARRLALDRLRALTVAPIPFNVDAGDDERVRAVNALREKLIPATPAPTKK